VSSVIIRVIYPQFLVARAWGEYGDAVIKSGTFVLICIFNMV